MAKPLHAMDATQRLNLSIVLPLRNQDQLKTLLSRIYDPSSPDYRHFLSVAEFTEQFGPSEPDYQRVVDFARSNGFEVTGFPANRLVVPISGTVDQVQRAFNVAMQVYQHPTESRTFFSPDREPSLALNVPIAHIAGLNDFSIPHSMAVKGPAERSFVGTAVQGSGPGASYLGSDMRAAYYGGSSLTGSGQVIGLLQFDGYYLSDVDLTFNNAGQAYSVPIANVLLDGADGTPATGDDTEEVLDIVQSIGMAPGLAQVRVYIGSIDADIFNAMASENLAKQLSVSWGWHPDDPATDDVFFEEFAAQGQSIFVASGDFGEFSPNSPFYYPAEDSWVTTVGGTTLQTKGAGGAWNAETAWSRSGGGVSPDGIAMPSWQSGVATSSNGGSTTLRNEPDVAMEGDFDNYACGMGSCANTWAGTSFASPRWAGFMALVNEQAAATGDPPTGLFNPALYHLGEGPDFHADLHDIISGNNNYYQTPPQPTLYAVPGYDLVTGWGSPSGQPLIDALSPWNDPAFQLSVSSSEVSIKPGGTGSVALTVAGRQGFNGSVNLVVTGLPNGVTAAWSANPVISSSVLTLTVSSDLKRAEYRITVTGTSGTLSSSTSFTLSVDAPGFALTASPETFTVMPGYSASTIFTVTSYGGFTGNVAYAVTSPLPRGVDAVWTTDSSTGNAMLTLVADRVADPAKMSGINITGTSGSLTATSTIYLQILEPFFLLNATPVPNTIVQGNSVRTNVSVVPWGDFNGVVTLSSIQMPQGVTANFSPASIRPGETSQLTLTASSTAPLGTSPANLEGQLPGEASSFGFNLNVTAAPTPSFTLTTSPDYLIVTQGSSASTTLTVNPLNGFSGNVNLSFQNTPGATSSFSVNPTSTSSVLTISVSNSVRAGSYDFPYYGTSGGQTAMGLIVVLVLPAIPFDLNIAPIPLIVAQGSSGTSRVTVLPQAGFSGSVSLAVTSALPAGVTTSFSTNPTSSASTLLVSASNSALPGQYSLNITGTNGPGVVTTTLPLNIANTSATLLSVSPANGVLPGGSMQSLTAAVQFGTSPVTQGQVEFCDIVSSPCTSSHVIGAAQLNSNGIGRLSFHPAVGNHLYEAVFSGTPNGAPPQLESASATTAVTVTGPTTTSIAATATSGQYTLTSDVRVSGSQNAATGIVTFVDTSNNNAILGTGPLGSPTRSFSVGSSQNFASGNAPAAVAVGDFNGDGNLDLAIVNSADGTITIMLGRGDGTFSTLTETLVAGTSPSAIIAGDFNGDGLIDLAVADTGENCVWIYIGNGDGTFQLGGLTWTDQGPDSIAAFDFNRDGILDLAIANREEGTLTVLLGNGDGTFNLRRQNDIDIENQPMSIVTGDFNGDGIADLAAVNSGSDDVSIFLGNGDGTFLAMGSGPSTGHLPQSIAVGDFNGDGILDLAVAGAGANTITVLLGGGDGTFSSFQQSLPGNADPTSIIARDFNGDGVLDLAVTNSDSTVSLLLGIGDGTFVATQARPTVGTGPAFIAAGDFNNDGMPDLATVNTQANNVTVLLTNVTATATASHSGVVITGPGNHSVNANYSGDSVLNASTSSSISISPSPKDSAAAPTFSPTPGTYISVQSVSISDSTPAAVIYYTTNGATPTTSSSIYNGPITVSASETIEAIATASGYSSSPVSTAVYTITPPAAGPTVSSISPAFTDAGSPAFTLTVTGSAFTPTSVVYWGTNALTTQYLGANQLTAQVPAASVAISGASTISVQNPDAGGSTSNALQFQVDSATASTSAPTFTTTTATVPAGSTASYPVTLPSSATSISATCLNLPSGSTCSYSSATRALTINTKSSTPDGIYQITAVFTETIPGASTAWLLFPILLLPLAAIRKRGAYPKIWLAGCLLLGLAVAGSVCGCGGSPSVGVSPSPPPSHQVTSSGVVSITVK